LSWFDWSLVEKHGDVLRFVQLLNARRSLRDVEHERERVSIRAMLDAANNAWHGVKLNGPDWSDHSHSVAYDAELRREGLRFYLILNAYWESLNFELPELPAGNSWRRWIDTALESPADITEWTQAPALVNHDYRVAARTVVFLYAEALRA
jgi:glycogen operon protein